MSTDRSALVNERVLFKKIGEGLEISEGSLELYNDSLLLKPMWRGQFSRGVRKEPMTSGEDISFSRIMEITGVVKGLILKTAVIRLQTERNVVWEIRANPKIYSALQAAFHAWRIGTPQ